MKKLLSIFIILSLIFSTAPLTGANTLSSDTDIDYLGSNTDTIQNLEISYPEILSIVPVSDGLRIRWAEYTGAHSYKLLLKRDGVMGWDTVTTTSSLSYVHKNLTSNTVYTYTLIACDENGKYISTHNESGYSAKFHNAPTLTGASHSDNGMCVKWDAVEGAEKYIVYNYSKDGGYVAIGHTTNTEFVHKKAIPGKMYTYNVRCVSEDSKTFTSYYSTQGIKGKYTKVPTITSIENVAIGSIITWDKFPSASKYTLFVKSDDGDSWEELETTTSTATTHIGLSDGDTYTYTVQALDENGNPIGSINNTGWTNTFLKEPVLTEAISVHGGMKISWEAKSGAESYKVYVKDGTSWKALDTTTSNSYIDTTAVSGNTYTYTVRCVSADGKINKSSFNTKGVTGTYIETPLIIKVENTATGVKITWNLVNGASKYKLFYKRTDGTGWKTIATTTLDHSTHDGLSDGDFYTYTVRACDENGSYISGYDNIGVDNTFIAPLSAVTANEENGSMLLSWESKSSVFGYRVYKKTIDSTFTAIGDSNKNTFTDSDIQNDTLYTYSVRCLNEKGDTISYFSEGERYYYNSKPADGEIIYNGTVYNFNNGYRAKGFVTVDDKTYYYDENGNLQKNKIVGDDESGYIYADENGVCVKNTEIQYAVDFVVNHSTGQTNSQKLRSCFNYLYQNYTYKRILGLPSDAQDLSNMAIDMFEEKKGNCFSYAATFACIATVLGYDARVITGQISASVGGVTPHGWNEIYYEGKWLICDANMQTYSSSLSYYMQTFESYPVKPLITEKTYSVSISDGASVWG